MEGVIWPDTQSVPQLRTVLTVSCGCPAAVTFLACAGLTPDTFLHCTTLNNCPIGARIIVTLDT